MISRLFSVKKAAALLTKSASSLKPYFEKQVADTMSARPTRADNYDFHVLVPHGSRYLQRIYRHFDVFGVYRDHDGDDHASFLTGQTFLGQTDTYTEYFKDHFRIWFRSQTDFEALNKAMDAEEEATPNSVYRFDAQRCYWEEGETYQVRSIGNLLGCEAVLDNIVKDLHNHQKHQAILKKLDEDKPMNILLYGAPGTGKTSTIMALASMNSLPIYIVNANGMKFDNLQAALSPRRDVDETGTRILLFEDFDRFLEHQDISTVMSQILNALDGIDNADSRTVRIFTGNNADAIFGNPAMINRMTSRFYFPPPTRVVLEKRFEQILTACGHKVDTLAISQLLDRAIKTGVNMRQWSAFILRFAFESQPISKMLSNIDQLDKRAM